jgi:hypothetical protein
MFVERPVVEELSLVPHHDSISEIERWVFPGMPYLVSVHSVTAAETADRSYCAAHFHRDYSEINLLIGTTRDFRYRVETDGIQRILGPVAAAFIPEGTTHSANLISGSGYYIVFKVPRK